MPRYRYRYKPGKGFENTHFKVNGVRVSAGNVVELAEGAPIIASVNSSVEGEIDQATGARRPALVLIEEAPPPSEDAPTARRRRAKALATPAEPTPAP